MDKVYVLLSWFYEGDSNLVDSFVGVYKTKEAALEKVKTESYWYDNDNVRHEVEPKFVDKFINGKKGGVSNVYMEGYEPADWGQYGSQSKFEIREITIKK